ncbi:hypothetical protein ASE36_03405 [Rhizobium sp. Root274]|uniref:ABC transporter ATP-binding protein n=1 Tax=unclassified Rhizobium TaxID=2613769 RepID=UPI0007136019|nr:MULTISPECIES: ABC transporter ATP-binding protein [unclassified Rhizobium]KQW31322.1 hypothetical protein ASC71_03405 [Rhizobium sp. Root1240]KRD32866.1 hypothetical protein ASE36_03405 [Rhizobium sp. Root274]
MKPVLTVDQLFKKYSKRQTEHKGDSFKDLIREIFLLPERSTENALRTDEFWAVSDVSFTLNPGDALALIGRNGSGKSTLLKMLNGVIRPDGGKVLVEGKMQALINLGAGFERRLSGRENVFHAAALMGLSRKETVEILPEILAFADIGDFIDSPVFTYSSGMYARLGFAVATHLRPDIILIDEILAVGDNAFKNKCFAKMHELKNRGVTMVLVSHSHAAISQFCNKALWLHRGKVKGFGDCAPILKDYLNFLEEEPDAGSGDKKPKNQKKLETNTLYGAIHDELEFIDDLQFRILQDGEEKSVVNVNTAITFEYRFALKATTTNLNISVNIYREDGLLITTLTTLNQQMTGKHHPGVIAHKIAIDDLNINPGKYVIVISIHEGHSYLFRNIVGRFKTINGETLTWGLVNFSHTYSDSENANDNRNSARTRSF